MKRKIYCTVVILISWYLGCSAQAIDYNKIILPAGSSEISFEERLVQLAWQNNPMTKMAVEDLKFAEGDLKVIRTNWTDQLGATFNLNEFTIKKFSDNYDPTLAPLNNYPRYNIYLRIPVSSIVQQPFLRQKAQSKVRFSAEKINSLKLELRAQVLKLYSEYKKNELVHGIRKDALADEESNYLLLEEKFQNGSVSLEDYVRGQKSRAEVKIQLAIAENALTQSKLDLEEVIGLKLEEVTR